jgi:rhamnose transport system ATP-binding protein
VLIMDEPTAALSSVEVERLFRVIAALRGRGAAIMFISHRLDEVFAICQQVTIMRDGKFVLTEPTGELDVDTIIRAMIGRDLGEMYQKTGTVPGEVVLAVDHFVRENVFYDVSFNVRRGEVVAL